jgi:DNA-binding transcriptional ArsR family regulator
VGPDTLDLVFEALADPTRRRILTRLASGEASVGELAKPSGISQPAVSKHLKVLERAGLITRGKDAQRRPSRLEPDALDDVSRWVQLLRRTWEERLDQLGEYLQDLQEKGAET